MMEAPPSGPTIVIASRREGPAGRPLEVWADVLMAVNSVTLYAAGLDVVLAWSGPGPPEGMLPNPRLRIVPQPPSCRSYGEAYGFAVAQTPAPELVLMNDDAVLTPGTLDELTDDLGLLRREHPEVRVGFLAARSNVAPGAQNVRSPNGGALRPNGMRYESESRILAAERVSPILAWVARQALDAIGGFPPINWFSDDLMCWDLRRLGYTHFVSRAYVHHVGMRSTLQGGVTERDLLRDGQAWVRRHRPDFWASIGGR